MLEKEQATKGAKLLVNEAVLMEVGTRGQTGHRVVELTRGDVVVVKAVPRKLGEELACRVIRGLSQTVGEVRWSDLRSCAVVLQ